MCHFCRTSGEVRLSDFLLWQSSSFPSDTTVYFTPALWPDFSAGQLLAAVFHFQRRRKRRAPTICQGEGRESDCSAQEGRIAKFLRWLEKEEEERTVSQES